MVYNGTEVMRLAAVLVGCIASSACRPVANVALDATGVPVIATAPDARFDDVRGTLAEVAARYRVARVHLAATVEDHADQHVELNAEDNDDLDVLLVVRVTKTSTVVGGYQANTDQEISSRTTSSLEGGASRFAVVRADDDARVADVMRATVAGEVVPIEVEFELGNVFQCSEPGDDRMARGAYTPSEVHSTYGTLPSLGCDRFPR